jgi:DNA primase
MDQLEEIKRRIDIVELIRQYVPLKKAGRNFKALCPFHKEKTPSFIVSPERQIWHCFGACNTGGDIFGFLMKIENMEFPEALRTLAKQAGVVLKRHQPSESGRLREKLFEINNLASEFFHWVLLETKTGKKALNYVLGRGVIHQSIKSFKLGYAPDSWENLQKFFLKKDYLLEEVEKAGLVVKREKKEGFYDRFRGRLMFPLRDHRGNVAGFAGRFLDPEATTAKYINTPETPVYIKGNLLYGLDITRQDIKSKDLAIVVEGELDVISSFQAGVKNVVAIKGSALTENQVRLLKRFTENIALALDKDVAGDAAARRGIEIADAAGLNIKVVQIKGGKDPDEVAQKNPRLWKKLVKDAVSVYDFFLDSAFSRFDKETAEGKKKIGQELLPILTQISDEIVKSHYLQKLARHLKVNEETLRITLGKLAKQKLEVAESEVEVGEKKKSRQEVLEEYYLSLLLQGFNLAPDLLKTKTIDLRTPVLRRILAKLQDFLAQKKTFTISAFVRTLPAELVEVVDRLYLSDLGKITQEVRILKHEIEKTQEKLKRLALQEKLMELSERIKGAEGENDGETIKLKREFNRIIAKLKKLNHLG